MRYIILKTPISEKEIKSRKKYIEKTTELFFIPYKIDEGVEFKSIPSSTIDCLFIVGHNLNVKYYLDKEIILEKYIAIISCTLSLPRKYSSKKKVYVSYDENGKTNYYDGADWDLDFNVSKEELKLINSYGNFIDRVNKYLRRII